MLKKLTYEELQQRVKELENEARERVRAEQALLESEARYHALVGTSFDVIFGLSVKNGTITSLNPAFEEITGWSNAEWLGKPFTSIIHPDDLSIATEKFQEVLSGKATSRFELRVPTKCGTHLLGEFIATPEFKNGKVVSIFGFARDITKRRRAEEALRQSEEKYRDIFENVSDLIYIQDLEGNFIETNRTFENEYGFSKEELANLNIKDVIPDRYKHEYKAYMERLLKNGRDEGLMAVVAKDGSEIIAEYRNSVIYDSERRPIGIRGSSRNITERIKAQKELKESEEKYRTILESIEDGYYELDIAGNFTFFNDSMCKIFGYPKNELLGIDNREYIDQENAKKMYEKFNKVFTTGIPDKGFDYEITRKDGVKRNIEVSVSLIKDSEGEKVGFRGIVRDVTDRKRVEEALRQSEEKYRTILEGIEDAYFEVDIAGSFTFFNDSMCKVLGYSRDELMGMNNRQYTDEENSEKVYQTFNRVYKTGNPERGFDWEFIRKDGTKRDVETSVSLVKDAEGQPIGFRGILRDITEKKRAQEALRKAHEELEKRVKERTKELAKTNKELEAKTNKLEEVNIALRILLRKRDEDKKELEKKILHNMRELVLPYLERLHNSDLNENQKAYVHITESNLKNIVSPFVRQLSSRYFELTPTEIQIANFVKHGRNTKEIADLLNLSKKTIETHRKNIRKKIGIQHTKANLRSHLLSIQ